MAWILGVAAVMVGGVGTLFLGLGIVDWRKKREVERTRTTPIAAVPPSTRVEVVGKVEAKGSFPAPITGKPCVWCRWHAKVESTEGTSELEGHRGRHLWLRDPTGLAKIDLDETDVTLPLDPSEGRGADIRGGETAVEADERVIALATERGIEATRVVDWTESRIEPDCQLYVLGAAEIERAPAGGQAYRGDMRLPVFRDGIAGSLFVSTQGEAATAKDLTFGIGCGSSVFGLCAATAALLAYLAWAL